MTPNACSAVLRVVTHGGIAVLALLGFAGCHTATVYEPYKTLGWEEHRLPNAAHPYDRLLVEIDAVKGTEPAAQELAELKTFLEQATNKPGGVTIKVDNIIPTAVARRRSSHSLALEYLNGPGDDRTAFVYILCYRSNLGHLFAKPDKPNFTYFPYPCAIFIDRSYAGFSIWFYYAQVHRALLRHEIGHALGLARNAAHSKDAHCTNDSCLMRTSIASNIWRFLRFRPPLENTELCADCRRDLNDYKSLEPKPNERLWHGYFVHASDNYQILTLPGFVYVNFGDLAKLVPETIAVERRRGWMDPGDLWFASRFDVPKDAEAIASFVTEQKGDEVLRDLGEKMLQACVTEAEAAKDKDPDQARAFVGDTLIEAAAEFPELQAKLKALREKLAESGAAPAIEAQGAATSSAAKP